MKFWRWTCDKVLGSDRGVKWLTAFCLAELMAVFAWPTLPHLWDEMAVAAHLRPPVGALPGAWRGLLSLLYAYVPADLVPSVLRIMGLISSVVLSSLIFDVLDDSLLDVLRFKMRLMVRGRAIVRFILAVSTMFFMCNDAVWRACQGFGTTTFHLLLAVTGLRLIIAYFHDGGNWRLYVAMAIVALRLNRPQDALRYAERAAKSAPEIEGDHPYAQEGAGGRRPAVPSRLRTLTGTGPIWYNTQEFPF